MTMQRGPVMVITGRFLAEFWDSVFACFVENGGGNKRWNLMVTRDSRGLVFSQNSFQTSRAAGDHSMPSKLILTNSLAELRAIDKDAIMREMAETLFKDIAEGSAVVDPQLLLPSILICYVDAKNLKYHFWLCCLTMPIPRGVGRTIGPVSSTLSKELAFEIYQAVFRFIVERNERTKDDEDLCTSASLLPPVLGLRRWYSDDNSAGQQTSSEYNILPLSDIWAERFDPNVFLVLFGGNEQGGAELPSYASNVLSLLWQRRNDSQAVSSGTGIEEETKDVADKDSQEELEQQQQHQLQIASKIREIKFICLRGRVIDQYWDIASVEADVGKQRMYAQSFLQRVSADKDLKDRSIVHSFKLEELTETVNNYEACRAFITAHGGGGGEAFMSTEEHEHLLHFDEVKHVGLVHALEGLLIKDKRLRAAAEVRNRTIPMAKTGLVTDEELERSWKGVVAAEEAYLDARERVEVEVDLTLELPDQENAIHEKSLARGWDYDADPRRFSPDEPTIVSTVQQKCPEALLEQASRLNLSLMTWREWPQLKLAVLREKSCLILGAGTLGCAVARCLLSWGFGSITLIDNGRVKYSNPTRQCLFEIDDCHGGENYNGDTHSSEHELSPPPSTAAAESAAPLSSTLALGESLGKPKAAAARDALHRIDPGADVHGIDLNIPSPGCMQGMEYSTQKAMTNECQSSISQLTEFIEKNDIVFSLLDTREARWLPTMLSAAAVAEGRKKLMITAAIGFDSYLVMRHSQTEKEGLGCYFCSDVTSGGGAGATPLSDRPLDQQCSVTRPGLSGMVGGLAVEMAVQLVQCEVASDNSKEKAEVPHQIRGSLKDWSQGCYEVPRFDKCVACSVGVITRHNPSSDWIMDVLRDPEVLPAVSGLEELMRKAEREMHDFDFDD